MVDAVTETAERRWWKLRFIKGTKLEISIEQIDGFGKNPGLWIRSEKENASIKVASFGSKEKADMFVDYMKKFLGLGGGDQQ